MKVVNLTPHTIHVYAHAADAEPLHVIEPTAPPARVEETTVQVSWMDDIPVWTTEFGEVDNLPEPAADTVFIVSRMVKDRVSNRSDVLCPGPAIRDGQGRIVGCVGFSI